MRQEIIIPDLGISETFLHESLLVRDDNGAIIYLAAATDPERTTTLMATHLSQYLFSPTLRAEIELILKCDESNIGRLLSDRLKIQELPTACIELFDKDSTPSYLFEDASTGSEKFIEAASGESNNEAFFETFEMVPEMATLLDFQVVSMPAGNEFHEALKKTRYLELQNSNKVGFMGEFFVFVLYVVD